MRPQMPRGKSSENGSLLGDIICDATLLLNDYIQTSIVIQIIMEFTLTRIRNNID